MTSHPQHNSVLQVGRIQNIFLKTSALWIGASLRGKSPHFPQYALGTVLQKSWTNQDVCTIHASSSLQAPPYLWASANKSEDYRGDFAGIDVVFLMRT